MRITKIDPLAGQQYKLKNRTLSNSQQKTRSLIVKKKYQPFVINDQKIIASKPTRLVHDTEDHQSMNYLPQERDQTSQKGSTKLFSHEFLSKEQRQNFIEQLEAQVKNESNMKFNEDSKGSKSKIKLPLISKGGLVTNQNQQPERMNFSQQSNSYHKNTPVSSNSNYQRNNQKDFQNKNRDSAIFINIKSVVPIQKTVSKKKDHSLRDLRILRKQKQEDCIIQGSVSKHENSKFKGQTLTMKKQKLSQKQSSPIRLTGDRKRSQINSSQKIHAVATREKRAFSINQSKKKYAISYMDFCLFISSLNKLKIVVAPIVSYKAYVGKGNNSILVKNAIKNRFWWNIVTQKNQADTNFVWQQSKCPIFMASLASSNTNIVILSERQNGVKKLKIHLQNKNQQKVNQNIKQFIQTGFLKLVSLKQAKQQNSTAYYSQFPNSESLPVQSTLQAVKTHMHNHLQFNAHLTNKKALFYNLKTYYQLIKDDPFKYIPLTFHVKEHGDAAWNQFKEIYEDKREHSHSLKDVKKKKKDKTSNPLWIIKPGENSNQGCGIQVSDSIEQIAEMVRTKSSTGKNRSAIIQKYLMPFLYNKRKFDIRCYMLATSIKGVIKGYWYEQGYIRTSSKQFTTKNLKNRMIHLTNDAVQKKGQDYGKYQNGNKVSFTDFQKYLDNNFPQKKLNFFRTVYPQMMRLAKDTLTATYQVLDSNCKQYTFEVFGLDFMIDEQFNTWLIEVNNNPCLQLSSPLLARIIPNMIQNALKIALDPMFPPPSSIPRTKSLSSQLFQSNKYTLIFKSSDIQQNFQHSISENKINLEKIIQGEEDQDLQDQEQDQDNKDRKDL